MIGESYKFHLVFLTHYIKKWGHTGDPISPSLNIKKNQNYYLKCDWVGKQVFRNKYNSGNIYIIIGESEKFYLVFVTHYF